MLINKYLIKVKKDIKKSLFIDNLEAELKEYSFSFDKFKKQIYPNKRDKTIFINYNIEKIYHKNKNRKNIFLLLYINYDYMDEEDDICIFIDKLKKNKNFRYIRIFREKFFSEIEKLESIEKIIVLEDKYNFCILKKSYPIIYEIENSMRELITLTMNFLAKENWYLNEIPEKVISKVKEDRKKLEIYGTDFSHLSEILFDRTENSGIGNLFSMIMELKECNNRKIQKIKEKVPKSNWQKYFSDIIIKDDIEKVRNEIYKDNKLSDEETIKKIFSNLSYFRNKIAHNNFHIDDNDKFYDDLERKSYYAKQWIDNALNNIKNKQIKNSNERIKEKLPKEIKKLIEKIDELIINVNNYYSLKKQNDKKLDDFLYKEFYEYDENEDRKICENYEIRKTKYFIKLKEQLLVEEKSLDENEIEDKIGDLDKLIKNINNYPKATPIIDKISEDNEIKEEE